MTLMKYSKTTMVFFLTLGCVSSMDPQRAPSPSTSIAPFPTPKFTNVSLRMAIGTVYNTHDAIIHHAQIPSNHLKVSIDISIEDDALLPIPIDEDIITVGLTLATFVAWPKHLIDVLLIMGKVSADDHSATSLPRIDEPASKKAKVNFPVDSTFNISFPEPLYGFHTEEFITINDVKDVHGCDWIGASVLSVYIRYLYDNFVPKSKKKVMFISHQANILGAGMVPNDTWKKQQSQIVGNILDKNKEIADLFNAPLNIGQHWILVVINRASHQLFYFDSLKNGDPDKYLVMQDIFNTALNTYRALNPKRQRPAKWIHVKTPHKNNNKDCGFYVINFMMETIKQGKVEVHVVIYFCCGIDNFHNVVIYFRCGREDPISTTPDIFNSYQSWDPRLSERFSLGRERFTWEGEILGYNGEFSPERELSRLGEKWHFRNVETVRFSHERESLA
ncbi:hypothetical protein Lal_00031986 [Lupinus albus]|nr:hypothetical protein Lal_00031986 [Lupinus albus]